MRHEAVERWLAGLPRPLMGPFGWTQLPGGHSNLTYRVEAADGAAVVVRRPPLGSRPSNAHDMSREYRILSALWPTAVPVPEPIGFTDDAAYTDAPVYVMSWVPGRTLYQRSDAVDFLTVQGRDRLSGAFVETLARLHALDPAAIGLGDLGGGRSYVERQLHRWRAALAAAGPEIDPRMQRLHDLLVRRMPVGRPGTLVHGDYGLHNCRVTAEGEVAAVIDWEISTVGDPLADLAYCVNAWVEDPAESAVAQKAPTVLPGFWSRDALVAHYADITGADMSDLDYYLCFNHWKFACIVTGVVARYEQGTKDPRGTNLEALRRRIAVSVGKAELAADRLVTATSA